MRRWLDAQVDRHLYDEIKRAWLRAKLHRARRRDARALPQLALRRVEEGGALEAGPALIRARGEMHRARLERRRRQLGRP